MAHDRQSEAEELRRLAPQLRPGSMRSDTRWRTTCWVHARPVAGLLAWVVPYGLMGVVGGVFALAAIGAGFDEPGAIPFAAGIAALFTLTGLANWAIARYAARAGLRRLQHLRTLPPPPGIR